MVGPIIIKSHHLVAEDRLLVPLAMTNANFLYKFGFINLCETLVARLPMLLDLLAQPSLELWQFALVLRRDPKLVWLRLRPEFLDCRHSLLTLMQGFPQVLCIVVVFVLTIEPVVRLCRLKIVHGKHVQIIVLERVSATNVCVLFANLRETKHFDQVCWSHQDSALGVIARTAHQD
jgi:hypothetical protein